MKNTIIQGSLCLLLVGLSLGCKKSSRNFDDDDDTSVRGGEEIADEELKYFDANPSISSDGSKVVFQSGRDEELRIYRKTVSQASKNPSRVTTEADDISSELEGIISPDGNLVAFVGIKDGEQSVFIRTYASKTSTLYEIEDDGGGSVDQLDFSPDSAVLTYVRRGSDDYLGSVVYASLIASDGEPSSTTAISDTDTDESFPVFTTNDGSRYRLVSLRWSTSDFSQTLVVRTLSTSLSVRSEALIEDINVNQVVALSGHEDSVIFVTNNPKSEDDDLYKGVIGIQGDGDTEKTLAVRNIPVSWDLSSESVSGFDATFGSSVLAASATRASGGLQAFIALEARLCSGEKEENIAYESYIHVVGSEDERIIVADVDDEYSITDDVCDEGVKEAKIRNRQLKIAADSTSDDYHIVYTTLDPSDDNEVRLLSYDGSDYTVTDISENEK